MNLNQLFFDTTNPQPSTTSTGDTVAEPIAIIATACRLGEGINSLSDYADALLSQRTVLKPLPDCLYQRDVTQMSAIHGGLIEDVFDFDPLLFGISPREANLMDPQQRLALKLAWELFEDAGITREQYHESPTGVFLGVSENTYLQHVADSVENKDKVYLPTGNALNAIAGRLSYCFSLSGPSVVIDTACSSSLVAISQAMRALRNNDCNLAIAGGLNVMLNSDRLQTLTEIGMLSKDGACRVFDEQASGYVRSEGAGMVMLKRLSDAERDQDRILGLALGSAINHNATSAGLTVPSGKAQQHVMRSALQDAGKTAGEVSWVEAHGTGTSLGDPIEFEAIHATYIGDQPEQGDDQADKQREQALQVTSLKSQFGHTESAAGVISVLKSLIVLQSKQLPAQFGLDTLNPAIKPFCQDINIPQNTLNLLNGQDGKPLLAGVNSFGFSGTNTSLIMSEYIAPSPSTEVDSLEPATNVNALALSGHSPAALEHNIKALHAYLQTCGDAQLPAIVQKLNTGRTHLRHRHAIAYTNQQDLVEQLADFQIERHQVKHSQNTRRPALVFTFPGQGAQYIGMAKSLHQSSPLFAQEFDDIAGRLSQRLGRDLLDIIWQQDETVLNTSTLLTQCAVFATSLALGRVLLSLGIEPDYLIGHSVGELSACALAGVWSLDDACDIIVRRGELMEQSGAAGKMLSIRANHEVVQQWLSDCCSEQSLALDIAAINGSKQVVVSGAFEAIEQAVISLQAARMAFVELPVSFAFHSRLMQGAAEQLAQFIATKPAHMPRYRICSTLSGQLETSCFSEAGYWATTVT